MASIHGTYRKVEETLPALRLLGEFIADANAGAVRILLDSPVSNSGRLKAAIENANERWKVELVNNPDPILAAGDEVVVSADSIILDSARRWVNLARHIIPSRIADAWIVDLSKPPTASERRRGVRR
jgi:hypothetical protein